MRTAVLICPGRGTYNKDELGYLSRHFPDRPLMAGFDKTRAAAGQKTLSKLDAAARFSAGTHTRGDNASGLIYAATVGDALSIDRSEIDIIAVTGNSMGWYSALACGGSVTPQAGFEISNTMGTLMQEAMIGAQLIYPFVGEDWQPDLKHKHALLDIVSEINTRKDNVLALSINLGGMLVLAGNEAGLAAFESAVPSRQGRFPMRLPNHAAFHTPQQSRVAEQGRARLPRHLIGQPSLPLIDGRGAIWWPHAADTDALYDYTLGAQVTEPYDFTRAITIAAREFAPDLFIITGPGTTLGGAVAQSLILSNWQGLASKADFQSRQADAPFLISMGNAEHRVIVT